MSWNTPGFSPDSRRLAINGPEGTIRIVAPTEAGSNDRRILASHTDTVYVSAFAPDGSRLVTASLDGTAALWDVSSRRRLFELRHEGPVVMARFSPDGKSVLTQSFDDTARLWDADSGAPLHRIDLGRPKEVYIPSHSKPMRYAVDMFTSRSFSPDGRRFLAERPTFKVAAIDSSSGDDHLQLPAGDIWSIVAYSPDGSRFVTCEFLTATPKVWDAETGARLFSLVGHRTTVQTLRFSSDGRRLVSAGDGAIIWDAITGELLLRLSEKGTTHALFDPSNRYVVTSSENTAEVWSAETGAHLASLSGHSGQVVSAFFSPDGSRILTLSFDNTIKVWTLDGRELVTLPVEGSLYHATWSPDGRSIVTSSSDGTARIWETIPWSELAASGDGDATLEEGLTAWRER